MLLQLENTDRKSVDKLLAFAGGNHLKLSLVDESDDYLLPGKPLSPEQLTQLIQDSRKSGAISMKNVHEIIKAIMQINYTADAFNLLVRLVNYIETTNTSDAGSL